MPSKEIDAGGFSPDVIEFMRLLRKHKVRYVIVGGEAVIYHGYPRVTGDVDFFYLADKNNAARLFSALKEFWQDRIPGVKKVEELQEPGVIIQFGRPPHRIDLLNAIDGVTFDEAWSSRICVSLVQSKGICRTYYVGLRPLVVNKQASGRPKDIEDLTFLKKKLRGSINASRKRG